MSLLSPCTLQASVLELESTEGGHCLVNWRVSSKCERVTLIPPWARSVPIVKFLSPRIMRPGLCTIRTSKSQILSSLTIWLGAARLNREGLR